MLELDLVLEPFVTARYAELDELDRVTMDELLELLYVTIDELLLGLLELELLGLELLVTHEFLHRGQDAMIPATGAPARLAAGVITHGEVAFKDFL